MNKIKDDDNDELNYNLLFSDQRPQKFSVLPTWINFDDNLFMISGTPPNSFVNKEISLKLVVSDNYFSVY